jgi:hypothetical protein
MAYTTINKPSDYFNTKLYTGNGGTNAQTGVGFQPDLTWIKCRDDTHNPNWFDAVRGVTKRISSHSTAAESTVATSLTSFDNDGFTLGSDGGQNFNSNTYVAWNWLASNTTASNTDGSITSTVSANTTSGFSIVSWTATNANGATIGHGLGTTPAIVITKRLNGTGDWLVGGSAIDTARGGANSLLLLNSTSAMDSNSEVYQTFSSTTFQVGVNAGSFANGATLISYCFADKQGFSKFGSYTGNGNANGTFVYTGFKPAFVIFKATHSTTSESWLLLDTVRQPSNVNNRRLRPNTSDVEDTPTANNVDLLSNGFKIRSSDNRLNGNGHTLIYMAFAEAPLVGTNGVTAKAR